ncbi:MAG TPA: biotin/lipoyl-containing protein, partial [Opitutus sp.]|nr:biotin/lipoyl-containing protein [Opitutus sp.]
MGQYTFKLPDVGEGTAEAEIVAWHVRVGDVVQEDAPLVDVMTDKATVEMTAPVSGKIVSIHGEPGDMAPVGGAIAVFETEAESSSPASGGGGERSEPEGGVQSTTSTAAKTPAAEGLTATPPKAEPPQAPPTNNGAKPKIKAPAGATWSEDQVQAAMQG